MKKKIISFLTIIAILATSLIALSGCGDKKKTDKDEKSTTNNTSKSGTTNTIDEIPTEEEKGRFYEIVSLYDKNINMFNSIVPEGWTAKIYTQDVVDSSYPFAETIVISSPDKKANITIFSQHSFVENKKYAEGQNTAYYTTYLHQMNASTYLDYYMNRIFKVSNTVKNKNVDNEVLNQLKVLHNLRIQLAKQDATNLQAQNYGVYITIGDKGYTSAKKEYKNGSAYYEASTSVSAVSTELKNSISSALNSTAIQWYMPYVIVYEGATKEAYDEYYEDYEFIMANSSFTKDYYQMIEYVSSAIVNAYTSIYAEKAKAGLQAMNDYINSTYSSTSAATTQDKVREMWSDVINERDKYILEDGSSIKTSIYNETVAQNGNEIYIGSKAGIPEGFSEVAKGYK